MTDRNKLICLLAKVCPLPFSTIGKIADYLVENGVTIQKWIPVTERLPDLSGDYLTNTRVRCPSIGCIDDLVDISIYEKSTGRWIALDGDKVHVTHWMPLPEAPKEERLCCGPLESERRI